MLSATVVASLLSLAALATAQAGRFPCDPLVATSCDNLVATGAETGADLFKSDGFTPVGAACAADPASGFFFCGYTGAACNPLNTGVQSACDNGVCTETDPLVPTVGTCTGSFGTACGSTETVCLGYLYCTGEDTLTTSSDACGGLGAYCQDPNLGGFPTAAENQPIYSATCQTNYCNAGTANCDNRVPAGGDCSVDPEFGCIDGFTCSAAFICEATIIPSGNARTRRNAQLSKRGVCPTSHTACPLPESRRGFECIDTESNLEQCGACFTNGGVDCTAIKGVDAVGCVSGQCEIWACASGFSFDHSSGSCVVALVA